MNGQSRETGNIWYTRHKTKTEQQEWTIQRNWIGYTRHRMKTNNTEGKSRMDNPEKLAKFGTQDTARRQTKLRGNEKWSIQRNWQH